MFGCGGKIELTTLYPMMFEVLVSRIDWTMRSLLPVYADLGIA